MRSGQRNDNNKFRRLISHFWDVWQEKVIQEFRVSLDEKTKAI